MREPLPIWVTEAMQRLEQQGEEAWLVGGCVRDRLLGRPVHDYDLAVSCPPDRTAELFRDHRLVEDGRKHGTIGVVTEGGVLEMTTFRADGAYQDHRHPESVRFVPSLREDLAREAALRDRCAALLEAIPGVELLGAREAPHILLASIPGVPTQNTINILQDHGVCVSAGSACAKGHRSHVLEAMGLPPEVVDGAFRISLSRFTAEEELAQLEAGLRTVVERMRRP